MQSEPFQTPDETPLPQSPRYSLRSLLIVCALLSALFALMSYVGPLWSTVLIWSLLLVAGHVLGNRWGSQAYHGEPASPSQRPSAAGRSLPRRAESLPENIRLRRAVSGGRARIVGIVLGAVLLGFVGGTSLTLFYWYQSTLPGIAVWYLSCGTVGALAGFVLSGLLQVFTIPTQRSASLAEARR